MHGGFASPRIGIRYSTEGRLTSDDVLEDRLPHNYFVFVKASFLDNLLSIFIRRWLGAAGQSFIEVQKCHVILRMKRRTQLNYLSSNIPKRNM